MLVVTGKVQEAAQVLHAVGSPIVEYLARFCRIGANAVASDQVTELLKLLYGKLAFFWLQFYARLGKSLENEVDVVHMFLKRA